MSYSWLYVMDTPSSPSSGIPQALAKPWHQCFSGRSIRSVLHEPCFSHFEYRAIVAGNFEYRQKASVCNRVHRPEPLQFHLYLKIACINRKLFCHLLIIYKRHVRHLESTVNQPFLIYFDSCSVHHQDLFSSWSHFHLKWVLIDLLIFFVE